MTTAGDFECEYTIVGYDGEKKGRSIGVDGIQAIWLAMKKIGSELDVIENKLSTKFFIGVDGSNPDHGFPKLGR